MEKEPTNHEKDIENTHLHEINMEIMRGCYYIKHQALMFFLVAEIAKIL